MCMICVEYQKGLLTYAEAWRNTGEVVDPGHRLEIRLMLEQDKMKKLKDAGLLPTKRPKK